MAKFILFQSSPAPKDGRYSSPSRPSAHDNGFNPRPPRRTGATSMGLERDEDRHVSILARPEGRALPDTVTVTVSPNKFQSSPAPKDGRYRGIFTKSRRRLCFNPRPPRRTGATMETWKVARVVHDVSILARPEGRALRPSTPLRMLETICFNPRPPRRTGATWTALPTTRTPLFQSSPAPKDGRYSTTSPRPENNCFSLSFREPIGNSFRLIRSNMIRFIQAIEK